MAGTVRIGLLGPLAVHDGAGRPVAVGGPRLRLLTILLALDAGRVVPAYSLIERLWEDAPPANAGNSLQSSISRLRASLREAGLDDGVIESHPAGYRLAIAPRDVDAVAFEQMARAGSQALASGDPAAARRLLTQALGIWRGPALADAANAEFAAGPAARLEESRTRASLDLIEAGLALGEGDSLVSELRAIVASDPLAERPRGMLMRALYAAGRQAEALAVYEQTRAELADRLGADPSPELERIYLSVLRRDLPRGPHSPAGAPDQAPSGAAVDAVDGAPPGVAATDGRAPAGRDAEVASGRPAWDGPPAALRVAGMRRPLSSFVGREEDIARVRQMLGRSRLVTLTGPGGAGKTRLAVELAARLDGEAGPARANEGGGHAADSGTQAWFVELAPVADPDEVPFAVLHALGIRESPVIGRAGGGQASGTPDPVDRLVAALAQRGDLLILDNCEHVVAAAAALADQVLAGCPDVRVLATSREPLRIGGEALWPVPSLPAPPLPAGAATEQADGALLAGDALSPGQISDYPAVRLLADRAAAVRPDFRVDESNAADVARICSALDGLPLAIELAAARLRTLSAAQLARRLDARFELLTGGSRTAAQRHQTLRAVVEWSWDLLSEAEQVLARRLAAFPGGAGLTAAEDVCQDGALPADAVLPALFGLVEKSFLAVDSAEEPRYRMLETVRAYCLEHLAQSGEEERVRRAFAEHFLHLAETADPLLRGAEQRAWMRRITAEQDNIHAALRWVIDRREVAMALRFGQALGWYWLLRGQRRESAALCREILSISDPARSADPGGGNGPHADPGGGNGPPADPGDSFDVSHARAVCALTVLNSSWDIAEVRQPLEEAWSLVAAPQADVAQRGERSPHPIAVLAAAMLATYGRQDPDQAVGLLAAQFESADPWTRSGARLMHAFFSMSVGRMDGVAEECADALAGFRRIGDRWGAALALMGQAELALLSGAYADAIAALEQAVVLSREVSDWDDTMQIHASLAKARSRLGDLDGARADMARAERIAREQAEPDAGLWLSFMRAELAWLDGDLAEVRDICERMDSAMAEKPATLVRPLRGLIQARGGRAIMLSGDVAQGRAMLSSALALTRESQDRSTVAAVMDALAAAAQTGGDRAGAERGATLLGAAHSVRGAFDHASLDAPEAARLARRVLGDAPFDAAYRRGRALDYHDALAFAAACAAVPVSE